MAVVKAIDARQLGDVAGRGAPTQSTGHANTLGVICGSDEGDVKVGHICGAIRHRVVSDATTEREVSPEVPLAYAKVMSVPVTVMGAGVRPVVAGPFTTSPVAIANLLLWHGQSMVPSAIWLQLHP